MSISTNLSESSGRDSPNRLKQDLFKTMTDKTGKKMMNPLKLPEIFSYFDTPNREKKWAAPNADVTDYFNFGLTEETFKLYAQKAKNLFNKLQKTGGAHFKQSGDSDKFYEDKLPITHGGLEIVDDNVLKTLTEAEWDLLTCNGDAYLDLIFKQHSHLDDVCKNIKATNNSVNNVYGLKKDPPPNVTMQPPPAMGNFALPRPQPPPMTMHQPPPRMTPPPMGPPSMGPPGMGPPGMYPPSMPHQMDYQGYGMMPRPPFMGYPPKPYEFNPMFPQSVMPNNARPPMEMPQPDMSMGEKKPKKKEEESEGSDESSDEKDKGKSQSKTSDRHKRSRSREKKHKSHREKDSDESKHHSHHRGRHERDEGSRRSHGDHEERSSKRDHYPQKSSREREREEDDGDMSLKGQGGRERRDWQKGYINNLIGSTVKEGRDRKDRRSSK